MIFRWKLVTLGLAIVFIVLVGVFSQILKAINQLPTVNYDTSFVVPLVNQLNDQAVPSVTQVSNLLSGITASYDGQGEKY